MNTKLIQYVRNKQGSPIACLVGISATAIGKQKVYVGWSAYHPDRETVPFSKEKARLIAVGRAVSSDIIQANPVYPTHYVNCTTKDGSVLVDSQDRTLPYVIHDELIYFITRCKRYFNVDVIANFTNEVN